MEQKEKTPEQPVYNMVGEKIALGPATKSLVEAMYRWSNDFTVSSYSGVPFRPFTLEGTEEYLKEETKNPFGGKVLFAIYELASHRLIGNCEWRTINPFDGTAEYGISIGERDCWGKGYGTEVTILMLDYAFNALGLHNVQLYTYSFNERAIRAYTRAGFRVMGRRREAVRRGDQRYDEIYMDCLASDFTSPLKPVVESY